MRGVLLFSALILLGVKTQEETATTMGIGIDFTTTENIITTDIEPSEGPKIIASLPEDTEEEETGDTQEETIPSVVSTDDDEAEESVITVAIVVPDATTQAIVPDPTLVDVPEPTEDDEPEPTEDDEPDQTPDDSDTDSVTQGLGEEFPTEPETISPPESGPEPIPEEEGENKTELLISKDDSGLVTCQVSDEMSTLTSCVIELWVNEAENKKADDVYTISTAIEEDDEVKCRATCNSEKGTVIMTAKHGPTNIFSMPIVILIAVGGLVIVSTILILMHFIKKSRRRKKGYSFGQLTGNSVEAYNLEEDVKPVAGGNGSVVVVSDSYNLVDG